MQHDIEGDPALVDSWNLAMKDRRVKKPLSPGLPVDRFEAAAVDADARPVGLRARAGGRGEDG